MAEKMTIGDAIKKNLGIILVAIVFFIFFFSGGREILQGKGRPGTSDTSSVTVQQPQPIIIMPQYQPQQVGNTSYPIVIPSQYQPAQDLTKLTEQYTKLANEFLAIKNYKDSIELKDTAGTKVGVVHLSQTVSENTLKSTQPTYQLSFPHTTTTITKYAPLKRQVFVGVSVESLLNKPNIQQIDLGLLLKNKTNEDIISISGTYSLPLKQPGVKIGYYKKLSFKVF
jgi:hypothetical protein